MRAISSAYPSGNGLVRRGPPVPNELLGDSASVLATELRSLAADVGTPSGGIDPNGCPERGRLMEQRTARTVYLHRWRIHRRVTVLCYVHHNPTWRKDVTVGDL